MNAKIINLGNQFSAKETIKDFKNNKYAPFDVEITNSHVSNLNKLVGRKIVRSNKLFINSYTLWEIMQNDSKQENHHHHGLTESDVFEAMYAIRNPKLLYVAKSKRYAIITTKPSHFGIPLLIVLEFGVGTKEHINAKANKIITIYPKDNIDKIIQKMNRNDILYRKK